MMRVGYRTVHHFVIGMHICMLNVDFSGCKNNFVFIAFLNDTVKNKVIIAVVPSICTLMTTNFAKSVSIAYSGFF